MDFPCNSMVRNLPTMQEMQILSLAQEYALEKEMATHSFQHSCLGNPMDGEAWQAASP